MSSQEGRKPPKSAIRVHLDARQAQEARFLVLEPLVNGIGVVAVDVGFLHERKGHAVVDLTKGGDGGVVAGFLTAKLGRDMRHFDGVLDALTWLQGNPRMTKPRSLYLSYRACRPV